MFEDFNNKLLKLNEIDTLKEIKSTSPHVLQIITYLLIFEYLIENWLNYRLNKGYDLFRGIEKIGFNNKLYLAKNPGLPKPIFNALNEINDQRNKFAHQIFKQSLTRSEIKKIGKLANDIDCTGGKFEELGAYENGKLIRASETNCEKALLLLALYALFGKVRNFVFTDIHINTSSELGP